MEIKKFLKERSIWIPIGNVKSLHNFKKNDMVCFSKLPEEISAGKELYNLYLFSNGVITQQVIIDRTIKNDLSKDLYFIKNASNVELASNMICENIKVEKPKKVDAILTEKLLSLAEKVEKKYVGKQNLIANSDALINYLTKFSEALDLIDDSKKSKKNEYIKTKEDVESFLKEELPELSLKNSFPTNAEPFDFLEKLEKDTIRMAMSAETWIEEKDLSMISVSLSDAVDVIKIGVNFANFEFVKACDGISSLDTLVRDYFNDEIYSWKNNFQTHYAKEKNLGHEYETKMKLKFNFKNESVEIMKEAEAEAEKVVKKVKKLKN